MIAVCMVLFGLFGFSLVCGVCGARGLAVCALVAGLAFAHAVAGHVARCAAM